MMFGAILLADIFEFFKTGWIRAEYIRPRFHFTYYGFSWVHPLPGNGMYYLFIALGVAALFILIGFAYRLAATVFFLGFTYVFLIEEALYLNHYYFASLVSFLMIFVPAHRKWSIDAILRPSIASEFAPAWSLWILRAQMGFVYFFGGVAKLNSEWLHGWPLRIWLPRDLMVPVLSHYRNELWLAMFFSYSGLCIDLFAVPLLLWKRSRPYMFAVLASFHLMNLNLFDIGIFPWFATAMTALYFEPDWPRKLIGRVASLVGRRTPSTPAVPLSAQGKFRTATAFALGVYLSIQVLLPLRHFLYPGDTEWTEEGHRFSWRMKLRDKTSRIGFTLTDPETGVSWSPTLTRYLRDFQFEPMSLRPDMIQQLARYLADQETEPGHKRVEVRADAKVSLNGRRYQAIVDPNVDLAATEPSLAPAPWITKLTAPRRKALLAQESSPASP